MLRIFTHFSITLVSNYYISMLNQRYHFSVKVLSHFFRREEKKFKRDFFYFSVKIKLSQTTINQSIKFQVIISSDFRMWLSFHCNKITNKLPECIISPFFMHLKFYTTVLTLQALCLEEPTATGFQGNFLMEINPLDCHRDCLTTFLNA